MAQPNKERFGLWLKKTRMEAGLSQTELGQRLGREKAHVSKMETGRLVPSLEIIDKISAALGVPFIEPLIHLGYLQEAINGAEHITARYQDLSLEHKELTDTLVSMLWKKESDAVRERRINPIPCIWCGKTSRGGICKDCREELIGSPKMTEVKLNDLPYGAIELDKTGMIIGFNRAEEEMARVSHKKVIGLNFFSQVAPCAKVQDFYGRFEDFMQGDESPVQFNFTYRFKRNRTQHVMIMLVRVDANRALITAKRIDEERLEDTA